MSKKLNSLKPFVEDNVKRKKLKDSYNNYFKIGNYATSNYFYRYMGLETAILCIRNSNIRFSEPCTWKDKLESRFYRANIFGRDASASNPALFAFCVTNKRYSEVAWKVYSYNATGLNAHCVQFKLNRMKLRNELIKAIGQKYTLHEGVVRYVFEDDLRNLHLKNAKQNSKLSYNDFFNNFDLKRYLDLLLLKNDAFQHEQETRFFLIPKNAIVQQKGKYNPVDLFVNWSEIIEEVYVDSNCSVTEINILSDTLLKFGNKGKPVTNNAKIRKLQPKKYNAYGKASDRRKIIIV